ncbi:MAG: hypothetical protein CSB44_01040 [Gammaproteobacteria bacterium]|nr:MAG: hypothetical protein CSB44_01040 [Gammaproteobacteria bacterium]PIE35764.1 MAG: hypothetical protein CSA54_05205 [Gammaproteobacteria bacterium]
MLVLELNEVPYKVIDAFVQRHPHSHWAEAVQRAARFEVFNPDSGQLHPKVSWQTFHRGVPDHVHGFLEYNQTDAPGAESCPNIWDRLRRAGHSVGVGASIGAWPVPEDHENIAFYLPDPFAPEPVAIPERLATFQQFNTRAVAHSGRNVRTGGFRFLDVARLAGNMAMLGISPATVWSTVEQLIDERRNHKRVVRRRNIQALLSFDVVLHQIRKQHPAFATIFANHVAAAMHRYWAAAFPDDYEQNNMHEDWRRDYGDEIDVAMTHADHMIGRLLKLAREQQDVKILVTSSMGQHAIEHEVTHNQLMISDMQAFMRAIGFENDEYRQLPGMEPEYVIDCRDEATADRFRGVLRQQVVVDGEPPMVKPSNATQTAFLVFRTNVDIDRILVNDREVPLTEAGLHVEAIQDMAGSTAQHVPAGSCLVFDGRNDLSRHSDAREHDMTRITTSILAHFDVPWDAPLQEPIEALVNALNDSGQASSQRSVGLTTGSTVAG